jgi:hypothetical protein
MRAVRHGFNGTPEARATSDAADLLLESFQEQVAQAESMRDLPGDRVWARMNGHPISRNWPTYRPRLKLRH